MMLLNMKKIEQPWNDNRLKLNGVYIDCVTKENADYIRSLEATLYAIAIGAFPPAKTNNDAEAEKLARKVLGIV